MTGRASPHAFPHDHTTFENVTGDIVDGDWQQCTSSYVWLGITQNSIVDLGGLYFIVHKAKANNDAAKCDQN